MRFGFEDRTRELLRGVWRHGSISAAASAVGMDAANAARHLRTAERRLATALVARHRGGRGAANARLTPQGRRMLELDSRRGVALLYLAKDGVTPVRLGGRLVFVAGRVAPGPVELQIRPDSVALDRQGRPHGTTSVRNRFAARVDRIEPASEGVFHVGLSAGSLAFESWIVRGAVRDLRLRRGSRVFATIKAVSLVAAARIDRSPPA
ncbi:MAG: TOBE domain-containing protein [Euryarchaeota archaeon]|nr:TOBE domain-containing protein [Euryarchaeota archaeon]